MVNIETVHYIFLDDLRKSGVTNMLGATPYLTNIFDLTNREARYVLASWMEDVTAGRWDTENSRGSVPTEGSKNP